MDPLEVIAANCPKGSAVHEILVQHSSLVANKALALARNLSHLNPDMDFIYEAAMLHDIGIIMTRTPELGCTGALPYICHGYAGRAILERAGLAPARTGLRTPCRRGNHDRRHSVREPAHPPSRHDPAEP